MDVSQVQTPITFPLSFAQQRLWFLDKLEPGLSVYNVPEAMRLKGLLDVCALEQSINEIVQRHEILRTTFVGVNGEPLQAVAPSLTLNIAIEDLSRLPVGQRDNLARDRVSDEANRPFNLESGPLLRLCLFRLAEDEHILLINMHHIVSEGGWSMGVFLRELNVLYDAFVAGQPSPLPELEIQYGDYTVWQRDWMQGRVLDGLLDFDGVPTLVEG